MDFIDISSADNQCSFDMRFVELQARVGLGQNLEARRLKHGSDRKFYLDFTMDIAVTSRCSSHWKFSSIAQGTTKALDRYWLI